MLFAMGKALVSGLLLLAGLMALVSLVFGVVFCARARKKRRGDKDLCMELAQEMNGECLDGTWPGLEEFKRGLVDAVLGGKSPDFVVKTRKDEIDVLFLGGKDDVARPSSGHVWAGCILRTDYVFPVAVLLFRGKGEGCMDAGGEVPSTWERVKVRWGPLKGYTLASPRIEEAVGILSRGVDRVLARVSRTIEGSIMPYCLLLQITGDKVALFVHEHGLAKVDDYLALYKGALGVVTSLVEFHGVQMDTPISRASFS